MKEVKIISQDNALTSSRHDFTALEKNILYMLMAQLSGNDKEDRYYYISINEMQNKTKVKSNYIDYENAIIRLQGKTIKITRPNGNKLITPFIGSAEYIARKGYIEIVIDPKMRPFLFNLKQNFTTFQLDLALSLKSKFSKRIYEMISQYKDTGFMTIRVLDLKEKLELYDPKTKVEQYIQWAAFKKGVLDVAKKEIDKETDLEFIVDTRKLGKKIEILDFYIKHKAYQTAIDFKDEETAIFGRLVNKFGLRSDQAQKAITKYGEKEVSKLIYPIMVEQSNGKIKNIGAYTAKVLGVN